MDRVVVLLLVIAATGAFSAWWKARDGRVRTGAAARPAGGDRSGQDRPDPVAGSSVSRWSTLPVEAADIAAAIAADGLEWQELTVFAALRQHAAPPAATRPQAAAAAAHLGDWHAEGLKERAVERLATTCSRANIWPRDSADLRSIIEAPIFCAFQRRCRRRLFPVAAVLSTFRRRTR